MSIIKNIKTGYEIGRDRKKFKKESKELWESHDKTMEMLDGELGKDDSHDRDMRVYEDTFTAPFEKYHTKYPRGFTDAEKDIGISGNLSSIIGETIPRVKKKSVKKPKRVVKKCKCK